MTIRPRLTRALAHAAVAALFASAASAGFAGDLANSQSARAGSSFDDDAQRVKARGSTGESGRRLDDDYAVVQRPAPRVRPSLALEEDDPAMVGGSTRADRPRRTANERE